LNYIKFLSIIGLVSSTLLAQGSGARAVKQAKEERYRIPPDEHFGSLSTDAHTVEAPKPIKGRAAKYLAGDDLNSVPAQASRTAQNFHLKPIDPNDLQIKRLLKDAKAAVPDSKEAADNLSAASILMYDSNRLEEAAKTQWEAATIYYNLNEGFKAARAFAKSAYYFDSLEDFSNAIQGYKNAGRLYLDNGKNIEAAKVFEKVAKLYESQKDYKEALEFYKQSSDAYLEATAYQKAIDLKWIIAEIYARAKKYENAAVTLEQIASTYELYTKDVRKSAEALVKAGYYYKDALDYEKAVQLFLVAHTIYKDLKLDRLVAQMETLIMSTRDMAEPVKIANKMRDAAQKKFLDLKRSAKEIDSHDREILQGLYYEIAQKYEALEKFAESAKALRNAGGFSIVTAHRIRFFELAAARYKKAKMVHEMAHMKTLVKALSTPKEQETLEVLAPLI